MKKICNLDVNNIEIETITEYPSIFKLKKALDIAGINYRFDNNSCPIMGESYEIVVKDPFVSIIEGYGSYGGHQDLLEIMGLLTEEESQYDSVVGYLTAQDVFDRIQAAV